MGDRMNKLDDFTKNPFVVPDNFFEKFNEEILTKLPEKQPQKKINFSVKKRVLPWVAAAAVMSGVIFTLKDTIFSSQDNKKTENAISADSSDFASAEDRDFYLYLQDDKANKELTSGSLSDY